MPHLHGIFPLYKASKHPLTVSYTWIQLYAVLLLEVEVFKAVEAPLHHFLAFFREQASWFLLLKI